MGGASAQISFYLPDQSILSDLFKLQVRYFKKIFIFGYSFADSKFSILAKIKI